MADDQGNLFDAPPPPTGERFDVLLRHKDVVIERIVSSAHPDQTDCLQDHDEWVVLLTGEARLTVAGEPTTLKPGDWLHLPAKTPHRVLTTAAGTTWLAVHLGPGV